MASLNYKFAQLNRSISIPQFTQEDYQQHLEDADWSFEETVYLLELCKQFDLRFIIISDRFEFQGKLRPTEDLKERYYTVTRKIQQVRNDPAEADVVPYNFSKAKEIERKKNLELLYNRPPEIEKEESLLLDELRRREVNEKKWAIERERIVRLLSSPENQSPVHAGAISNLKKVKKFGSRPEDIGSADSGPGSLRKDRKSSLKLLDDAQSPLKKEKVPPGAYLRTSRLYLPKQGIQAKVKEIMDEYGLAPIPTIPTASVCEKFDILRYNIVNMLELKKVVDRQEQELRVLEGRKDGLIQSGAQPSAAGSMSDSQGPSSAGVSAVKKFKKRPADGSPATPRDIKRQK
ncbi:swr complex subunit [Phlyctochytrium planicorne]|nr:swr complex subunit [Phlyctochytrium planicorne]